NLPFPLAPVNHSRRIGSCQFSSRGKMRVIERDVVWRYPVAVSLHVDVSGTDVPNSQNPRRFVERVSVLSKILPATERFSARRDRLGQEVDAEYIGRIGIEGRISDRARAVRNFRHGRERTKKMRFIGRGPFRNGPEGIHHASWSIGKFVGEPPLVAPRCVGISGEPLKISYPIERAECFFLVSHVSSFCKI